MLAWLLTRERMNARMNVAGTGERGIEENNHRHYTVDLGKTQEGDFGCRRS
jgi:hypothetical protein